MKNLKRIILSFLLIVSILSSKVFAFSDNLNGEIKLKDTLTIYTDSFDKKSQILSGLYNINPLDNLKKDIRKKIKESLDIYVYYSDFTNIEDREIFFSDKSINKINRFILPEEKNNQFISNYYNKNYLKVYLENETIFIEGVDQFAQTWSLVFYDDKDNKIDLSSLSTIPINNNIYKKKFHITDFSNIKSMTISLNRHKLNKYYPSKYEFVFDRDKKGFKESKVYENNKEIYYSKSLEDPNNFLSLEHIDNKHLETIKNKALEITRKANTDYEKLLAIHTWVSNNIYYDFDSIKYDKRGPNDAYNTYADKKAVCQGYAELSLALCRSLDIPTKLIYGYALGAVDGEDSWTSEAMEQPLNHAWNEAYIDGRWIIFDTTWDSSNKFEEKRFISEKGSLKYFDPSIKAFSNTHRIDKIVDL